MKKALVRMQNLWVGFPVLSTSQDLKCRFTTIILVSVVVKDKFDAPINDVDLSSAKPLSKLLRKRVLKERI